MYVYTASGFGSSAGGCDCRGMAAAHSKERLLLEQFGKAVMWQGRSVVRLIETSVGDVLQIMRALPIRMVVLTAVLLAMLMAPDSAPASQLLAAGIGVVDSAMNGATVASPRGPSAAAFSNPAAITIFDSGAKSFSTAIFFGSDSVDANTGAGRYKDDHSFVGFGPEFGVSYRGKKGWSYGFSIYGSVGASFFHDKNPAVGVSADLFSDLSIVNGALMVAYDFGNGLSLGAELSPLFGRLRVHHALVFPLRYKLQGPGIQGMLGLRYELRKGFTLGLGLRTPGMIWTKGSSVLPTGGRQDMDMNIKMPTQVFAGINYDVSDRLELGWSVRFTDSSSLGDTIIEFDKLPQANVPLVPDGNDEWRVGLGTEYRVGSRVSVFGGFSWADSIVGRRGVSPLLFDATDIRLSAGVSYDFGHTIVDLMVGYGVPADRNVSSDKALVFPGKYDIGGEIMMIGLRRSI